MATAVAMFDAPADSYATDRNTDLFAFVDAELWRRGKIMKQLFALALLFALIAAMQAYPALAVVPQPGKAEAPTTAEDGAVDDNSPGAEL